MPKKVDHRERREQIAAALLRVAGEHGLEAVSLRHVAANAGVTSGMVQHYFPSKDAMMSFAMRSASARYEARMNDAIAGLGEDPTARELVDTMLTALLPLDENHVADARVALAFQSYAATNRDAAEELGAGSAQMRAYIAELLRGASTGERADIIADPVHTATALLAMAEGLAVQILSAGLSTEVAAAALQHHLDLVFGALPR